MKPAKSPEPDPPRLVWVRAADRYPDADPENSFIAMDGEVEVGVVKLVPAPAGAEWMWSFWLTHPGPAFKQPTNGRCGRSGQAARELDACWRAFRAWFGAGEGEGA